MVSLVWSSVKLLESPVGAHVEAVDDGRISESREWTLP